LVVRILLLSLFLLESLALTSSYAEDQTAKVKLKSLVDRATATTSQQVTFSIELSRDQKIEIEIPQVGARIAGLRVVDFGQDPDQKRGEIVYSRHYYILEADISGTYILPAIKIEYRDSAGKTKYASSGEIFLEITGIASSGDQEKRDDIRDIKGLIERPIDYLKIIIWTLSLLTVLGISFAIYYFMIRRSDKGKLLPSIPPREVALAALEALRQQLPRGSIGQKEFSFSISFIVRSFIEEQFSFPATDRTTEEIGKAVNTIISLSDDERSEFYQILQGVELIKFADYSLAEAEQMNLIKRSEDLIASSAPKIEDRSIAEQEDSII
jgi:hypothetical protein